MAKRRLVFFPELGRYFTSLREARQWAQAQAADIAHRRRIPLTYQALRGLEEGKTKRVEPELLRAVADLYEKPYEEIASEFVRQRYGLSASTVSDLLRKGTKVPQTPERTGESDDPAAARIRYLEDRLAAYKAIVRRIRRPIEELLTLTVDRDKGGKALRAATWRRRRD